MRVLEESMLAPARAARSGANLIVKYPQWYDRFHERGYEVIRETADFDKTWVGTETRDYGDARWGGTPAKPLKVWFRELTTLARLAREKGSADASADE